MAIGDKISEYLKQKEQATVAAPEPRAPEPVAAEPSMAGVTLLLMDLIKEMKGGNQNAAMLQQAELLQQILVKTKPENTTAPMISVYSYPEGETAKPKPELKCKMTQCGYELNANTLTVAEVEALNALRPGIFKVTKGTGTPIEFHVRPVVDALGRTEWLHIWYPCKGQDRNDHRSFLEYLKEAMGTPLPSMDELMRQLEEMKAKLQAVA